MSTNNALALIETAIKTRSKLEMKVMSGSGGAVDVEFDPYIYGSDAMQFSFIWGYLPFNNLIYKFRLSDIIALKLLDKQFTVVDWAVYYYSCDEELWLLAEHLSTPHFRS